MRKNLPSTIASAGIYAKRYFTNISCKNLYRKLIKRAYEICSFENNWLHLSRIIKGQKGLANRKQPLQKPTKPTELAITHYKSMR